MKKIVLKFMLLIMTSGIVTAQTTKEICYEKPLKEKELIDPTVIGEIGRDVYLASIKSKVTDTSKQKELRLSIYNCDSLKMVKTVAVKGFGVKKSDPLLKGAIIQNTIMKNEKIYVFWHNRSGKLNNFIIQIFDKDLNEIQKPKVLSTLEEQSKYYTLTQFFFLISPDGKKMIVGGEELSTQKKNLKMRYKVFDADFNILNIVATELPYTVQLYGTPTSTTAEYQMNNNGDLFFKTNILLNEDINNPERGFLFGSVNSDNSTLNSKLVSFENKDIRCLNFAIRDDGLFVFGTCQSKDKESKYLVEIFSFNTDLFKLETKSDVVFSRADVDKITYSDCVMNKDDKLKYSVETYALYLMNSGLIITGFVETEDQGLLLSLRSVSAYHFAKLNKNGTIDWISVTDKSYRQNTNLLEDKGTYYAVMSNQDEERIIYQIDSKSGIKSKKTITIEDDELILNQNNGEVYFFKFKQKLKNGAKVVKITSIVFTPLAIGIFPLLMMDFFPIKRDLVYFGKYEFAQ